MPAVSLQCVSGELTLVTAKAKPKAKAQGTKATIGTRVATGTANASAKAKSIPKVVTKTKSSPKGVVKVKAKPVPKSVTKTPAKLMPKTAPKTVKKTIEKNMPPIAHKAMPNASAKVETRVAGLLTESELIKQPKAEYMSSAQRKFFKHRLLELQTQMRDNADATTEHLRELAVAPDPADRATQEEEHALELRTRDRERKLLKKIEAALLRLEDGSYGYCEETGDPIGVRRLLARPTATLTIEAQERRELKQKMYGE